jgi:hypothetical protein
MCASLCPLYNLGDETTELITRQEQTREDCVNIVYVMYYDYLNTDEPFLRNRQLAAGQEF